MGMGSRSILLSELHAQDLVNRWGSFLTVNDLSNNDYL
jgi:hypothetical protein